MSLCILDTDTLSLFQHGHVAVCTQVANRPEAELATTVITVQEQLDGWNARLHRAKQPNEIAQVYQRLAETVRFLSRLQIVSFTEPAVLRYEHLKSLKLNIGKMDCVLRPSPWNAQRFSLPGTRAIFNGFQD